MSDERADHRLARLVERLLSAADSAASSGDWERVREISADVLDADPTNERARSLRERAEAEQSLTEGQRAFVTMLFSDLVRSTDLADVREPEIVRDLFRVYRQAVTEEIESLGGCVLQFMGDGVVACFGYPAVFEDDARRAVLAGLGLSNGWHRRHPSCAGVTASRLRSGLVCIPGRW
jgi:class 3 adenylate cyclase